MPNQYISLNDRLYDYLLSVSLREHPMQQKIRQDLPHIESNHFASMPEVAQLLQFLVGLIGAKRVLEIGTYIGYSALSMALALPDDGELITCEIKANWAAMAQSYWQQAGVSDKVSLRLQPALTTLAELAAEGRQFDVAFIDADKGAYVDYYEQCLALLRVGGLLIIDNTLWGGGVVDMDNQQHKTQVIRQLNQRLHADARIALTVLPMGDGVSLGRKLSV